MGNITIQGDLTGDVPGGEVGGASNLTTVGAIPYVSAAGILNQDPTALFWDAANNRLGVGTATPSHGNIVSATSVAASSPFGGPTQVNFASINSDPSVNNWVLFANLSSSGTLASGFGSQIVNQSLHYGDMAWFTRGSGGFGERFRLSSTGNLLIGTTTDSNFKLDVAASGSAGTARFYGGSGVTASTKVVVQAGGGQSGNLQEWQNAAGTVLGFVRASDGLLGYPVLSTADVQTAALSNSGTGYTAGLNLRSAGGIGWSSTGNWFDTKDLSLYRASAGVLQVGDGGSNANGYLSAARVGVGTSTWADGGVSYSLNVDTGGSVLRPIRITSSNVDASIDFTNTASGGSRYNFGSTATGSGAGRGFAIYDVTSGGTALLIAATTRNLIVGGTTDGNYKLDVQNSGSTGTLRVYDQTATTGVTKAVIRAGAGQGTTNLQEWENNSGNVLSSVKSDGTIQGYVVIGSLGFYVGNSNQWLHSLSTGFINSSASFRFGPTGILGWNPTSWTETTSDVGLTRNAAGVLEINNGTAGTYRDLILRRSQHNGVTVAALPAAAAGNAGSIQYVTDANATTIGSTVAGGGANKVMVWSDGAAWKIFAS